MPATGATGFLGRHLGEATGAGAWVAPSSSSLDLRDRERVLQTIGDWRPT